MLTDPTAHVPHDDFAVPEMSEAQIRDSVSRQILAILPQPMDAKLYAEAMMAVDPVIDEIVAQCLRNPSQADTIIATMVSSAVGEVRQQMDRAEETAKIIREEASGGKKKPTKKISFKYSKRHSQIGEGLTDEDRIRIEAAMEDIFDNEIPSHVDYVEMGGNYYWQINLEGEGDRFVLLPFENMRMVTVMADAQGNLRIVEQVAPSLAGVAAATTDAAGEVVSRTREIIWDRSNIREALGESFSDIESLADLLRQREEVMDRLMMIYQAEKERIQQELDAAVEEQLDRMPVENILGMPEQFEPGLPDDLNASALSQRQHQQPVFA